MTWRIPIPRMLVPTANRDLVVASHQTQLPLAPHPGAFGVERKHHTHEGVDLYAPVGTPVFAVEDGVVVAVIPFTGTRAEPPTDEFWFDTDAVLVEGPSGVVVYGEITPWVVEGQPVDCDTQLGTVLRVLKKDKGFPTSMLHLELHTTGTRCALDWHDERPSTLLDPTPFLLEAVTVKR